MKVPRPGEFASCDVSGVNVQRTLRDAVSDLLLLNLEPEHYVGTDLCLSLTTVLRIMDIECQIIPAPDLRLSTGTPYTKATHPSDSQGNP